MPDLKISQLTSWTPTTSDTTTFVQGWVNKQSTIGELPISTATQSALDTKVETVVAWTNITVDNTDPLNPIISASTGAVSFIDLTDTPASYVWQAGKVPIVNGTETWLEFTSAMGTWDVIWPASAVDSNFASFDTVSGKLIKDSGSKASDFAPALWPDDNYVTDAEKIVIGNTSGTNTGDQDLSGLVPYLWATQNVDLWSNTIQAGNFSEDFLSETWALTGFINNTWITINYSHTNRTVTLTGTIEYFWRWIKKTLASGWVSPAHDNVTANYFLSSTDWENFSWSTTPWSFEDIMVAYVKFDAVWAANSFALREVHWTLDYNAHQVFHNQIWTHRISGGTLTAWTYTENTATNAATTPWFDSAVIRDEDIDTTIPAWTEWSYTQMYVWASSTVTFVKWASYPFIETWSFLQVNNVWTWALTNWVTWRWYNVYQILVPCTADSDSQSFRMIMLQPQATHTSLANALAEDARSLNLGNFANLATEWVIYARITYVTSAWDANAGKCRIATGWVTYIVGNRWSQTSVSGFNPTDHTVLDNLDWASSGHTWTANSIAWFWASWEAITSTTIAETAISFTDVTTGNASSTKHWFLPKLDNTGTKYLRDDGTWQTVSSWSAPTYETNVDGQVYLGIIARFTVTTTQTIAWVKASLWSLPTWADFKIDVRKNWTASTNSIFTSDTPISITTGQSATNWIYTTTSTTIDNGSLVANDVLYVVVTQIWSTLPWSDLTLIAY